MSPGEAGLAAHELRKADDALDEGRLLLQAGAVEGAISRLYYAAFHAARAALAAQGRYAKTHSGTITVFRESCGDAGPLSSLLQLRGEADYGTERFSRSQQEVERALREAVRFVGRCHELVAAERAGSDEPDPAPDL